MCPTDGCGSPNQLLNQRFQFDSSLLPRGQVLDLSDPFGKITLADHDGGARTGTGSSLHRAAELAVAIPEVGRDPLGSQGIDQPHTDALGGRTDRHDVDLDAPSWLRARAFGLKREQDALHA